MSKIEFYDISKILTYNRIFNFVLGNRTAGKSFSAKKFIVKKFLEKGEQFIYLRRYDNELEQVKTLFDDISFLFPDVYFEVKGREFYINGELAGFAIPLSLQHKLKSVTFVNVNTIMFDEFLVEKRNGYLKNEVETFLSLYMTVARGGGAVTRNVRVLFIANAVSIVNPYFAYFNIKPKKGITKSFSWVTEMFVNESVNQAYEGTQIANILRGTSYGDYALHNKFYLDDNSFVEDINLQNYYLRAVLAIHEQKFGVWLNPQTGGLYCCNKYDLSCPYKYCFEKNSHNEDYILLYKAKKTPLIKVLCDAFELSMLRFDSIKTKEYFIEVLNYIY